MSEETNHMLFMGRDYEDSRPKPDEPPSEEDPFPLTEWEKKDMLYWKHRYSELAKKLNLNIKL